jgi:hypothetical protein
MPAQANSSRDPIFIITRAIWTGVPVMQVNTLSLHPRPIKQTNKQLPPKFLSMKNEVGTYV